MLRYFATWKGESQIANFTNWNDKKLCTISNETYFKQCLTLFQNKYFMHNAQNSDTKTVKKIQKHCAFADNHKKVCDLVILMFYNEEV